MYGLVNKGIYELVVNQYGKESWNSIRAQAGLGEDDFISMESYPDGLTYKLIAATSQILQITQEKVLEKFGEYWITHTANEGYGNLLDMAGTTFTDFLKNLDQLHSCVGHIMPGVSPPSFQCTDIRDKSLVLHHYSSREGLEHMVVGLITGLGKRFQLECSVTMKESTRTGGDHNVFLIEWR